MEFFRAQFDKLLLAFFVLLFTFVFIFVFKHGADGKALDWAAGGFSSFVGALLMLLTANKNSQKKEE